MYLHFFPDGGLPAVYLETVKQRLDELARQADPDTFFLPTETSLIEAGWDDTTLQLLAQKARGFAVPRRSGWLHSEPWSRTSSLDQMLQGL